VVRVLCEEALHHVTVDNCWLAESGDIGSSLNRLAPGFHHRPAALTIARSLDSHKAVKVLLDENTDLLAPALDRVDQVVDTRLEVLVARVWVLDTEEDLWVKRLGREERRSACTGSE
jgi:hypothetical protein